MAPVRVIHLVDDMTAGGVMRVVEHLTTAPAMSGFAIHRVVRISRMTALPGQIDADVIVSHLAVSWRMLSFFAALRISHARTRLIHVEHSYTEGFIAHNVSNRTRFMALLRLSYRLFDRVVAVSEAQSGWLRRAGLVQRHALRTIPSCVDLSGFRALAPPTGPARTIGAIGRLERQKGFDTLIAAFTGVDAPDLRLLIFGEGGDEPQLRRLAKDDPRIRFMGFARDPIAAMQAVDLVVMPSRWEAFGLVAIEALAAGRKLVVSNVDGLRDHLAYGAVTTDGNTIGAWRGALNAVSAGGTENEPEAIARGLAFEQQSLEHWQDLLCEAFVSQREAVLSRP